MSEKRFIRKGTIISDIQNGTAYLLESASDCNRLLDLLNEQQDQISYWKHKVSSLLWILGQFDKAKVKELLKELNNECELDDE